jgi:hypothetical protein
MDVNITLFTLLHFYMFQPSRGHLCGVLIHHVNKVVLTYICALVRLLYKKQV